MITLRCTQRLLRRLRASPEANDIATGRLGNWYANLITVDRKPVVLSINETSRLAVLLPLKDSRTLLERFRKEVTATLWALNEDAAITQAEVDELHEIRIGPTRNRSVVGTLKDFENLIWWDQHTPGQKTSDLRVLAKRLHETPCLPIRGFPLDRTREFLRELEMSAGKGRDWAQGQAPP